MGAGQRGQGTGRTQRAFVSRTVLLVVMPGLSGTDAQQKHDGQRRNDTGEDCSSHNMDGSRQARRSREPRAHADCRKPQPAV